MHSICTAAVRKIRKHICPKSIINRDMQRDKGDGMQPMHGDNISSHMPIRAGSGQSPTRNLARGPWVLSGPTRPGPNFE